MFEYQGSLGGYRSCVDLPAPNLLYFSDHRDLSHPSFQDTDQLFDRSTPLLRYLLTSSTAYWDRATLSSLAEFHFARSGPGPALSLCSLLNLLQSAPRLEILRLEWLGQFIHDCVTHAKVPLPHLHTLQAHNTDLCELAGHIYIPNIHKTIFTVNTPTHPSFQDPHALISFPLISNLSQPVSKLIVAVVSTTEGGDFRIRLTASGGCFFDIHLVWEIGVLQYWKSYVRETLSVLKDCIELDSKAILRLFLGICPTSRGSLRIQGDFARALVRALGNHEKPRGILPPFVARLLIAIDTKLVDEDETQMLRFCLRSRDTCEAGLYISLRHGDSPWERKKECRSLDYNDCACSTNTPSPLPEHYRRR